MNMSVVKGWQGEQSCVRCNVMFSNIFRFRFEVRDVCVKSWGVWRLFRTTLRAGWSETMFQTQNSK